MSDYEPNWNAKTAGIMLPYADHYYPSRWRQAVDVTLPKTVKFGVTPAQFRLWKDWWWDCCVACGFQVKAFVSVIMHQPEFGELTRGQVSRNYSARLSGITQSGSKKLKKERRREDSSETMGLLLEQLSMIRREIDQIKGMKSQQAGGVPTTYLSTLRPRTIPTRNREEGGAKDQGDE